MKIYMKGWVLSENAFKHCLATSCWPQVSPLRSLLFHVFTPTSLYSPSNPTSASNQWITECWVSSWPVVSRLVHICSSTPTSAECRWRKQAGHQKPPGLARPTGQAGELLIYVCQLYMAVNQILSQQLAGKRRTHHQLIGKDQIVSPSRWPLRSSNPLRRTRRPATITQQSTGEPSCMRSRAVI